MRVLHLISSAGMYGAESVILTLMQQMQRSGSPHALGAFDNSANPNHALHSAAIQNGFESHLVTCKRQIDRETLRTISDLAASTGAEIVHTHGYKADVYGYYAMQACKTPLVSTCHNWLDLDLATKVYGVLDRHCLKKFAAVAAVSQDVRKRLLRANVKESKVSLILNGIHWQVFADHAKSRVTLDNNSGKQLVVGFAGRLSLEKGTDLFIATVEGIAKAMPDTRFIIAGDGAEREAAVRLIKEKRLIEKVTLLGRVEDMPAFYASIDILLSSSRIEGLPMGLLEAMASRLPVVATSVGDVATVLQNGVTGLLVPSLDVEAMQHAVIKLLRDPKLRRSIGHSAQQRVIEQFSAERMAADYERMYQRAIA